MPQLLTPEQLDQIRQIIQKHHALMILKVIGPDALTPDELKLLEDETSLTPEVKSMEQAYVYGQLLAKLGQKALDMSYDQLGREAPQVPLGAPERAAISNANQHAGAHIRHLGARIEQQAAMLVFREDADMRAKLLTEEVRPATKENLERREGIQKLKSELGHRVGDWSRDWNRVAVTEKVNAMNAGQADSFRRSFGDPWVYKQPMPTACKHCLRLHIGPDGHPRIFKLSTLQANGTNAGKKAVDWAPVVGATHPHCQCQLIRVPDGWGFDKDGTLVPGGEGGIRYDSEGDIIKAVMLEDQLQKAFAVKERVNVGGMPISIEQRIGDLRHWKGEDGTEGTTRMIFAYGYIEDTLGPDGDEYDVYVGPDPLAPFVFIVHQQNPETGEWDEDKAMLGFPNADTAKLAYLAHYDSDKFFGSMSMMPIEEFREKVGFTRRPGSMQSDGMVKGGDTLAYKAALAAGLTPEEADAYAAAGPGAGLPSTWLRKRRVQKALHSEASGAQFSPMGKREIANGAGINFVLGMGSPFEHLQAQRSPGVQIPVKELQTREDRSRTYGVALVGDGLYQDAVTVEEVKGWGDRPEQVYCITQAPTLGKLSKEEIAKNRFHLDAEIAKRLQRVTPNYSDPEKKRFVVKSAGPFVGPRGGLWADPQHKIPWKEKKPVLTRTPLRAEEPVQKRAWKEGFPKGIQRPSFNSWETGQRGGTEQKHWDAKTQNFKPARLKLHAKIKTKMTKGSKAVPEGQKPVVLITMGGPASGKTTMVEFMHSTDVFDPNGFVRIDADSIKEELPEYKKMINEHWRMAAAAVHHESTTVMRGLKQQSISERRNMIIDTTGADLDVLLEDIKDMREQGYEIRVLMPHLDVQTGITRAHKRAEASGRFVPDDVVQNIYQKVPKNVAAIAQVADRFDLLDNTIDPKLIYTKRDGKHLIHDEKLVKHFPGLFEAATAKTPGPDGSLKKAQEIDPAIKQLLERLKQERDKPHQKKYDPKAGDYTLDLPMVDGLSGQILEGTVV